jgi:uncharacterized membrane protein YgcG
VALVVFFLEFIVIARALFRRIVGRFIERWIVVRPRQRRRWVWLMGADVFVFKKYIRAPQARDYTCTMRSFVNRLFGLMLAFCVVGGAFALPAQAQESKLLVWEHLDVEIDVQDNGDLRVKETNVINFTQGAFRFGYRDFSVERLTSISDIAVVDDSDAPMRFETLTAESGDFRIKYFFNTPAQDERRTIRMVYTVKGATRYYPGGDQVYWAAVFPARNGFDVLKSRVTLRLPANSDATQAAAYGPRFKISGAGERTVVYEATEPVRSGTTFEVRAQFAHGVISGAAPAWQRAFDEQRTYDENVKPRNNALAGLIAALLGLGGPAFAWVLWVTRGRDPNVGLVADYVTEPPAISPGLGGTLIDESADLKDIIASLFDLAKRGVITLQEVDGDHRGARDYLIAPGPQVKMALRPFEERIVNALSVRDGGERKLSDFVNRFYANLDLIKSELYQELVEQGLYVNNPPKVRAQYQAIGGLLIALGIGSCFLSFLAVSFADTAVCIPVGVIATAIAFLIISRHMPMRTRNGAEIKMKLAAFKRYLENIEKYTDLEAAKDQFAAYLPWAIAFGLEKSWVNKFARVNAPIPPWYGPYGHQPYYHGYGNSYGGGRSAGPASPSSGPQRGDISDRAQNTQGRGIGGLEQGAAMGMAGLERGFAGMFDSVGRTFQSQPQPVMSSSSSSGGFSSSSSSGGFSGGGGGGGGSSGGGGGGFG